MHTAVSQFEPFEVGRVGTQFGANVQKNNEPPHEYPQYVVLHELCRLFHCSNTQPAEPNVKSSSTAAVGSRIA